MLKAVREHLLAVDDLLGVAKAGQQLALGDLEQLAVPR